MTASSPSHPTDLERILRSLHLPLDPDLEHRAAAVAQNYLIGKKIPPREQADYITGMMKQWEDSGAPSPLVGLIGELLSECGGEDLQSFCKNYFKAHKRLIDSGSLSFYEARLLLSNVRLIIHLLRNERMSCTQVARILSSMTRSGSYSWKQINLLPTLIGIMRPTMSPEDILDIYSNDLDHQLAKFADASPTEEHSILVEASIELGFPANSAIILERIMKPDFSPSFMIILHFVLSICERYDHSPSIAYEFSPRGRAGESLQSTNTTYSAGGTAILNVAKSASVLDHSWAWARDDRDNALALADLLQGLEEMPYIARRELAAWVRQWIVRSNDRNDTPPLWLPGIHSPIVVIELLESLIEDQTHSYGTIEQRIVDALTLVLHPTEEWSNHGRKDSVHASNLSRRKLGDCEYISRRTSRICAYEAHAGNLSQRYMESHFSSIAPVIHQRHDDLAARSAPEDWDISITFVSHDIDADLDSMILEYGNYSVFVSATTYADLLERVRYGKEQILVGSVNDSLIGSLNESTIPQIFRDRVAEIGNLTLVDS